MAREGPDGRAMVVGGTPSLGPVRPPDPPYPAHTQGEPILGRHEVGLNPHWHFCPQLQQAQLQLTHRLRNS